MNFTKIDKMKQIEQICEDISNGKIKNWTSELLDSTQRYQIHKLVDNYNDLITKTISIEGIVENKKKIYIEKCVKNLIEKNKIFDEINHLTKEQIDLFIKYSKLPIPINLPEHLEYYLNVMKPYYDIEQYNNFISDIKKIGYQQLKYDIIKIKNELVSLLKSNEKYQLFITNESIKPKYPQNFTNKNTIYNSNNLDKNLLSVDIRSANWTCYKKITLQEMNNSWATLLSKYTTSKFIQNSKYLREVVFGEMNSKKITKFITDFIFDLDQTINLNLELKENLEKIMCTTDEIIYNIKDVNKFNLEIFMKKVSTTLPDFDIIYRVEQFVLKQIYPYDYFVKEIINTNTNQIEFKQIPKHFIFQSIKYYQNEKPNELDKKFIFENIVSTFDSELCFEKII